MPHRNKIVDNNPFFTIDVDTREIKSDLNRSVRLMQGDHNSERFTFTLPRVIEGHDMMECNAIEVHYTNIDSSTSELTDGVYDVEDIHISETDAEKAVFSWLVSHNATSRVGKLEFLIRFACVENGIVTYAWNTALFEDATILRGKCNSTPVVTEYADILEQWRNEFGNIVGGDGSSIVIDNAMSATSKNAVQNKVVKQYIDDNDNSVRTLAVSAGQTAVQSKTIAENAEQIAKGRATGYAFDTEEDMRNWLKNAEFQANLVHGDNLYIRALDVPDYWWDSQTQDVYPLETQKVDMSDYTTKASFIYDEVTETLIITI